MNKSLPKYGTLFSLYIAQSVPMSFFSTVLPVIMRLNHFSMTNIALIQLIKIPWVLKFLWAPLLDKNNTSLNHYRRWIFGSELFYAAAILIIAFFNLETNFTTIIIFMVIAIFASATQDIASDAFAIRILKKEERPLGNSIQSMGNFGGTLIGSGLLLILYSKMGWSWLIIALAGFVLLALLPLGIFKTKPAYSDEIQKEKLTLKRVLVFFKIEGIGSWILILVLLYSGIIGILSTLKPWMVDLGYEIKNIAFMVGIFGTACGTLSALAGGFLIKVLNIKRSLLIFALYNLFAAACFWILSYIQPTKGQLYGGIAILWSAYAMSSVIVNTVAMNKVRSGNEGSDFSIQIVLAHLSSMLIAVLAGKLADVLSVKGMFGVETLWAALVLIIVIIFAKKALKTNNE